MDSNLERLRNAKRGDLVVVMGKFFDQNFWQDSGGQLYPTLILVDENDTKNGCYWFEVAVSYDDTHDRVVARWFSDNFYYDDLWKDGTILTVCEPTVKQYRAILAEAVAFYSDMTKWAAEGAYKNVTRTEKQIKFLAYARQLTEYYESHKTLRGFSKEMRAAGVSKLTHEQFFTLGLDKGEKSDDELLAIYEQIKKRER